MSAVEEIETAIAKLEHLRTIAPEGLKFFDGPDFATVETADGHAFALTMYPDLLLTLHHTIDAQLALLRNFTEVYGAHHTPNGYAQAILNLARAINGTA